MRRLDQGSLRGALPSPGPLCLRIGESGLRTGIRNAEPSMAPSPTPLPRAALCEAQDASCPQMSETFRPHPGPLRGERGILGGVVQSCAQDLERNYNFWKKFVEFRLEGVGFQPTAIHRLK